MALALRCALALALAAGSSQHVEPAGLGPGAVLADRFHPERASFAEEVPHRGGTVRVHLASLPASLDYLLVNQASARHVLLELHEPLVERDPESWEWRGVLARSWELSDRLRVRTAQGERELLGSLEERENGWLVHVLPEAGASAGGVLVLAREDLLERLPGTVITFHLRDDVRWHDGRPFDAGDVLFTYECARNPALAVPRRHRFEKLRSCEALDPHTVRFVFEEPYFLALSTFDLNFTLLPAHRFDPRAADFVGAEEKGGVWDDEALARSVRENPANREWIGLGPYRLVRFDAQAIEAERCEDYFDPRRSGWVQRIRWRTLPNPGAVREALLAGELDYTDRLDVDAFFGEFVREPRFRERLYSAHLWLPYLGYVAWNLRRPELADARVRRALALCFDWPRFLERHYHGLAFRVTGEQFPGGAWYDAALQPVPFDPRAAAELLAEAGWYDRDGDGRVDRDGRALELELVQAAGNPASEAFAILYQEELARIGVGLRPVPLEPTTFAARVKEHAFDGASLAWSLELESDPEQLWHSRWAEGGGGNHPGLADAQVDRLIEALQVELDDARRALLFQRLQRRVYELQPYLFGACVARRLAVAKRLRGVQLFALDPGISIRRWWIAAEGSGSGQHEGDPAPR